MRDRSFNPRTFYADQESAEADPQATTQEIIEFKKQYDAMIREAKAQLPKWLREYIEGNISSN
jgi:F0F1-type ATP synthase membrane subunit b/b'